MNTVHNSIAGAGGDGCFRKGTMVLQSGGKSTPIDLLKVGDEVVSFDESGKVCLSKVTKVHVHEDPQPLLRVRFWGGFVDATPNHWVLNQYEAFSEIGRLSTEDALVDGMGQLRPIISAESIASEAVYNLTVVPNHTFIANNVRVHNGGHRSQFPEIAGAGGDGGGKGGGRKAVEDPNSLKSTAMVSIVDLIGEGEIGGIVGGSHGVFINDTPLENLSGSSNFKGVFWEQRTGTPNQTPIDGFADVSTPKSVGVKIPKDKPSVINVSSHLVDSVRIVMSVPALTSQDTTTGDLHGSEVSYSIVATPDRGGAPIEVLVTISGKTVSKYQRSTLVTLPKGLGTWSIRVSRVTADAATASVNNELWFDYYTEIINSRLSYPNSALVGIRIDSEQFSSIPSRSYLVDGLYIQVPGNYDAQTKVYTGIWNGALKPAISSNPAWILYDLLTNQRYGLGGFISATQVDKSTLYRLGRYCDELVEDGYGKTEPRFSINTAIQSTGEAYRLIGDISSAFRGMTYWNGSQIGFTQDAPSDPTMIYSPANVVGGEFQYAGSARKDRHSVVHVTWNDPTDRYRQQIEYVEDAELVSQFGVRKAQVVAFGCTSRGQANRVGRWVLYSERYETNVVSFVVGLDSALAAPGEVVRIQDPTKAGKRMAGRIAACTLTSATLDAPVTLAGSEGSISLRMPDGSFVDRSIIQGAGVHSELTWAEPLAVAPESGAMFIVIEKILKPMLARILSIMPGTDGTYAISAVEHNPTKYAAIDFNLSLEVPKTSVVRTMVADPENLQVLETQYVVAPGVLGNKLHISWFGNAPKYELRWRQVGATPTSWVTVILSESSYEMENVSLGGLELEVVAFSALFRSAILKYSHTVRGKITPPKALSVLYATGEAMQIRLSWEYAGLSQDTECIEIWSNASVNSVDSASRIAVLPWPQTGYLDTGKGIGIRIYYFARVKDKSGNYSSWTSAIGESISDPSLLMEQLNKSIGIDQIVVDLAVPMKRLADGIESISQVIDPLNLKFPTSELDRRLNEALTDMGKMDRNSILAAAAAAAATAAAAAAETRSGLANEVATNAKTIANAANAAANSAGVASDLATSVANLAKAASESALKTAGLIDFGAINDAITSAENNAQSLIGAALEQDTIFRQVNGSLLPRAAVAEKTLDKVITELSSEVTSRETLAARFNDNVAALHSEINIRASETSSLSQKISFMEAKVGKDIAATISLIQTTQASETEALSQQIQEFTATVIPGIEAKILEQVSALATTESAFSNKLTKLQASLQKGIDAAVSNEETARTTKEAALASSLVQLTANFQTTAAEISDEKITRASETEGLASEVKALKSSTGGNSAAIVEERLARSSQIDSVSKKSDLISARLNNGDFATIAEKASASVDAKGATTQAEKVLAASLASGELAAIKQTADVAVTPLEAKAVAQEVLTASLKPGGPLAEIKRRAEISVNETAVKTIFENELTASLSAGGPLATIKSKAEASVSADEAKTAASEVLTASLQSGALALIKKTAEAATTPDEAKTAASEVLTASLGTGSLSLIKKTAEAAVTKTQAGTLITDAFTASLVEGGPLAEIKRRAESSATLSDAKAAAEEVLTSSLKDGPLSAIKRTADTAATLEQAKSTAASEILASLKDGGSLASIKDKAEAAVDELGAKTIFGTEMSASLAPGGKLATIKSQAEAAVTDLGARSIFNQELNAAMDGVGTPLAIVKSQAAAAVTKEGAKGIFGDEMSLLFKPGGTLATIKSTADAAVTKEGAKTIYETALTASLSDGSSALAGVSAKATAAADAVDGYKATYVLRAQADGIYAGMTLGADPSGTGSSVVFAADKFAISVGGGLAPKNIFVAAIVNGQRTVGIDGSLVVTGTVDASHIKTDTLSAITANVGLLRTRESGARLEISGESIRVYDDFGLRVVIGNLS